MIFISIRKCVKVAILPSTFLMYCSNSSDISLDYLTDVCHMWVVFKDTVGFGPIKLMALVKKRAEIKLYLLLS